MTIQTDLLGATVKVVYTENKFVPISIQGLDGTIRSVYQDGGAIAYTVDIGGTLYEMGAWGFTVLTESGEKT